MPRPALTVQGQPAACVTPARGGGRVAAKRINSATGEGLARAAKEAQVIVDLPNSRSWEDAAVLAFRQKSTGDLIAVAEANDVEHYIALSVVGTEHLQASGSFVAKLAQEALIKSQGGQYGAPGPPVQRKCGRTTQLGKEPQVRSG